jgi:hypothetical protein
MASTNPAGKCIRMSHTLAVLALFIVLAGNACKQAVNSPAENKTPTANVANAAKPAETQAKTAEPAPVGKEISPATGPALKSIIPPEGAILGGVLNGIATSLPEPDPAAAKAANANGTVTVEVLVNEKGEVSSSSVVSGPLPELPLERPNSTRRCTRANPSKLRAC